MIVKLDVVASYDDFELTLMQRWLYYRKTKNFFPVYKYLVRYDNNVSVMLTDSELHDNDTVDMELLDSQENQMDINFVKNFQKSYQK